MFSVVSEPKYWLEKKHKWNFNLRIRFFDLIPSNRVSKVCSVLRNRLFFPFKHDLEASSLRMLCHSIRRYSASYKERKVISLVLPITTGFHQGQQCNGGIYILGVTKSCLIRLKVWSLGGNACLKLET